MKLTLAAAVMEQKWGDDFDMRIFCEDKQYKALKFLLERNS
jgi:hypothetical protein